MLERIIELTAENLGACLLYTSLDFLKNFHNAGKTLITITHNRQLAENLGTRFAVMNEEHELKVL